MKQEKIEQFANQIKDWNGKGNISIIISFWSYFLILIWHCLTRDFSEWMELNVVVTVICEIGILVIYIASHMNQYTRINGMKGKIPEHLADSVCRMPFSVNDYYKYIGKMLSRRIAIIAVLTVFVLTVGAFLQVEITNYYETSMVDINVKSPENAEQWLQLLMVLLAGCLILVGAVWVTYFTHRRMTLRQCETNQQGLYSKQRKTHKSKKNSNAAVVIFLVLIALFIPSWVFQRVWLAVPDEIECYISVRSATIICVLGGVLGAELQEYLRERKKRKRLSIYGLVVVLAIFGQVTDYTRYYEDKIETSCMLVKTEYAWNEVKSFTVKKGFLQSNIQLELEMEDNNLKVIRGDAFATKTYYDRYNSEYSYVLALVKRLDALGIEGAIEDVTKLEKLAEKTIEEDESAVDALKEIKRIVEGKEKNEVVCLYSDEYSPVTYNGKFYFLSEDKVISADNTSSKGLAVTIKESPEEYIMSLLEKKSFYYDVTDEERKILFMQGDDVYGNYMSEDLIEDEQRVKELFDTYDDYVVQQQQFGYSERIPSLNGELPRKVVSKEVVESLEETFGAVTYHIEDFNKTNAIYYIFAGCVDNQDFLEKYCDGNYFCVGDIYDTEIPKIVIGVIIEQDGKLYYGNTDNEIPEDIVAKMAIN